jgi:hypothetical protein
MGTGRLVLTGLVAASLLVIGGLAAPRLAAPASAQAGTGTVTGQVVWGTGPIYYAPANPDGTSSAPSAGMEDPNAEVAPDMAAPSAEGFARPVPGPIFRPPVPRPIPAGAVLVAVQGTNISARTDESGNFTVEVPAGQYLTVAAGPVRGASGTFVMRPNVKVNAGGRVSLGRLYLGQPYSYGVTPYAAPGAAPEAAPEEMP